MTELNFEFSPVSAMPVSIAYMVFTPERFAACPPKVDMAAYQNDTGNAVTPPPVADECLTIELVALTNLGDLTSLE